MPRLTLTFRGITLQEIPISSTPIGIGRDPANLVHIDSLAVSPYHARIESTPEGEILRQLDAHGPVTVNEQPVTEHCLRDGDRIGIGKHHILFTDDTFVRTEESAPASPAARPELPSSDTQDARLQVMNGKHIGLVIPLRKGLARLGKDGGALAAIVRRKEGYFLSPLAADGGVSVNGQPVAEDVVLLQEGDIITVDHSHMRFFTQRPPQGA